MSLGLLLPGSAKYDDPVWRKVYDLYYEDKVEVALELAEGLGGTHERGGDINHIYAEAVARQKGHIHDVAPWLRLETIPDEEPFGASHLAELVKQECEGLAGRFGWDFSESVRVTLLPREAESEWMPARYGYFVDKVPYDKICLPAHLVAHPQALAATVRHEYMHHINLNMGRGHASRWLEEGLATYAEGLRDHEAANAFIQGDAAWRSPHELNLLVAADKRAARERPAIRLAYAQCNLVVRFLVRHHGEGSLVQLLKTLGDHGPLAVLSHLLVPRPYVDAALRKVFHMSEDEVFDKAREWVKSQASRPA